MASGANDGIVTTFAVVAGVTGGGLSVDVVLTTGGTSLLADGFSMAAPDSLGNGSEQATVPYFIADSTDPLFAHTASSTPTALVAVGMPRALVSHRSMWKSTLEMQGVGEVAALLAY